MPFRPFAPLAGLSILFIVAATLVFGGRAAAQPAEPSVVTAFEWASAGTHLRVTIDGDPASEILLLSAPHRIAIDLADTLAAARPPAVDGDGPVAAMRDGLSAHDRYRLLFTLREPALPIVSAQSRDGHTVLDIVFEPASAAAYAQALAARAEREATGAGENAAGDGTGSRFTVVIDPGHGGADYGAVGEGGTMEKDLNLSFARALRESLERRDEAIEVQLTREEDVLVPLAERSATARRAGADLFVSVHADSIGHRDLRGATVYTLSLNASDQLARDLAESENAADRFAGPEWTQDTPEIHDILVDLVQRETEHLSRRFSDQLVVEMRRADIRLINNPQRSAGFRVLMAPDVPSVLLEMGYLSNAEDEALMAGAGWQENTADVVAEAIAAFLLAR